MCNAPVGLGAKRTLTFLSAIIWVSIGKSWQKLNFFSTLLFFFCTFRKNFSGYGTFEEEKKFSWRDLLYKSLLFVGTVALIVYFLPRDGKFNYQFDINKPWKYGQLIATFDFPIYKEDAVVKREQDSLMAFFQPYYQLIKI